MKLKLPIYIIILCLISSCKKETDTASEFLLLTDNISIHLNPYDITPLSALAIIKTNNESRVKITVHGAVPLEHQFDALQKEHEVPVLGLYPDTINQVVFEISNGGQNTILDTQYIQTQPLPDLFPTIEIATAKTDRMEPGWTLCDFSIGKMTYFETYPFMIDHQGAIRWYADFSFVQKLVMPVSKTSAGNMLCAYQGVIYEYSMLGEEVDKWGISGFNQHHDVLEKRDGNLMVSVNKSGIGTVEDHVIEIHRESGNIINEWDFRQVLDMNRPVINGSSVDWLHMNAVWPDEADKGVIISGKHQGVAKINKNNDLQWILAPHKDWKQAGPNGDGIQTADYLLTAIDANGTPYPDAVQMGDERATDFDWPWGQHAVMKLDNGSIMLFDNGSPRQFGNATETYSRMVEYEINAENQTVQQVWSFGRELGEEMRSGIISDVDEHTLTGNRMMTAGINWFNNTPNSHIMEVSYPDQEVVFDAKVVFKNLENSAEYIWYRFDMLYRAERFEIYD